MEHRWAFDADPLSGESVGYCLNHCDEHWYQGEDQPSAPCPGDTRPVPTGRITFLGLVPTDL